MHLAVHACVRSKKELFHYHFQAHPRQLGCVGGLGLLVVAKCLWRSWFIRSSVGDTSRTSSTHSECVPCKCFWCRTLACPDSSQLAGVTALPFSVSLFRTTRRIRDASTVITNSFSSFWVNMLCVLSLVECFRSEFGPLWHRFVSATVYIKLQNASFSSGWPFKSSFVVLRRQLNKLLRVISLTFVAGISFIVILTRAFAQIEWNNLPPAINSFAIKVNLHELKGSELWFKSVGVSDACF